MNTSDDALLDDALSLDELLARAVAADVTISRRKGAGVIVILGRVAGRTCLAETLLIATVTTTDLYTGKTTP